MVVDKIEHASLYYGLGERFRTALEWLASADAGALTPGQRVDIDGDNVFATLFEVDTLPPEACKLECHQNYADIQYLLSGMEGAGYALPDAELHALSEYDPKGDIQFYTAEWDTLTIRRVPSTSSGPRISTPPVWRWDSLAGAASGGKGKIKIRYSARRKNRLSAAA